MKVAAICLLIVISVVPTLAQNATEAPDPWFSTFSIIAFDPATREFGVGVQSRAFGAGAAVPWAEPALGAVATQASANRSYGPKAMEMLRQGMSPAAIVKKMTDEDPGRDTRQVAVIDSKGQSAVYTGKNVIDRNFNANDPVHYGAWAGHITGKNFSVQGNTLASENVVKAMAAAYENSQGSMAERLMNALDAGQSEGGDVRGMQSAGILVVRPLPADSQSTVERIVDIRVDDAENPFVELRRILNITLGLANRHTTAANELVQQGKFAEAIDEQKKALDINPRSEQLHYSLAQRYAQAGEFLSSLKVLENAVKMQPALKKQAAADPVFAKMKDLPEFRRIVAP